MVAIEILVADLLFFVGLFYLLAPLEVLRVVYRQFGVRFVWSPDLQTEVAELFVRVQGALWFSLALAIFFLAYYGPQQRQRWAANGPVLIAICSLAVQGILLLFLEAKFLVPVIHVALLLSPSRSPSSGLQAALPGATGGCGVYSLRKLPA